MTHSRLTTPRAVGTQRKIETSAVCDGETSAVVARIEEVVDAD